MDMERRVFLKQTAAAGIVGLPPLPALAQTSRVRLIVDLADPAGTSAPVQWAIDRLQAALALKGVEAQIIGAIDGTAADISSGLSSRAVEARADSQLWGGGGGH